MALEDVKMVEISVFPRREGGTEHDVNVPTFK
jgi:hypothetical protein